MKSFTHLDLGPYEKMYDAFDGGHNLKHCHTVRELAVLLAQKYLPNKVELAYIAATLHDIGLSIDRENHESEGEKLIRHDQYLIDNLSPDDFEEICHAVKEHRASTGNPQTILAKIISDADRGGGCYGSADALNRAYQYGLKNYLNFTDDEQINEAARHQTEKFSPGSYGRRTYFSETEVRLSQIYDPIIKAYKNQDFKYLKSLIHPLVK